MTWDQQAAELVAGNVAAFGVSVTVKHVTARGYDTATGKNGRTESSTTVTADNPVGVVFSSGKFRISLDEVASH